MKNDAKWNTISGLDKVIHTAKDKCDTEQRRKIDLTEFFKAISRECANHLSWVASTRDEQWEEAEKSGDLRIAITQFCEAVGATENYTEQMFKRFEDDVERMDNVDASTYLTIRKLYHLIRLRMYFEHRLKIMLIERRVDRETCREQIREMLSPLLGEPTFGKY
jgi:hypothetical protein